MNPDLEDRNPNFNPSGRDEIYGRAGASLSTVVLLTELHDGSTYSEIEAWCRANGKRVPPYSGFRWAVDRGLIYVEPVFERGVFVYRPC